ncbi:MAG: hypothetical protein M1493_02460 [Firmicutes bacterium]|nr:hypothetical protein [Bacillota bacterium]
MVTFAQDVCRTIHIGIQCQTLFRAIQSALYTLSVKSDFWVGTVPDRHRLVVQETRRGCVGLLLFDLLPSVAFAQVFQWGTPWSMGYLDNVLIVPLAHVNILFPIRMVTDDESPTLPSEAVVHEVSCRLHQVIVNTMVTIHRHPGHLL